MGGRLLQAKLGTGHFLRLARSVQERIRPLLIHVLNERFIFDDSIDRFGSSMQATYRRCAVSAVEKIGGVSFQLAIPKFRKLEAYATRLAMA